MDSAAHSEGFLTDLRDFWWNNDFIELMAKRWNLSSVKSMLDVGCGVGHWGQMLLPYLSKDANIKGIDPESKWIEKAKARAQAKGISANTEYFLGSAENIPFTDNLFDMVTCQTVLIHISDISLALKEMIRVLKPGGLLAVSEPNNGVSCLIFNNLNFQNSIDDILDSIRFQLIYERGKSNLNEGHNSNGDLIPFHFYKSGLKNIKVYLSDMADYFIPPYNTSREKAVVSSAEYPTEEEWKSLKLQYQRYFLSGGGNFEEFDKLWKTVVSRTDTKFKGYKNNTLCTAGGEILYLISGTK